VNVVDATASYESWLQTQLSVVLADDLALKHERMAEASFPFLRATYYLWLARLTKDVLPGLADAPSVVAVGDLHVENFGCWRDSQGRLAWGVNDFDEIATLPYTFDLLRLSASALLAAREGHLPLDEKEVSALVLAGYRDSLQSGGKPFVAGAHHRWLGIPNVSAKAFWAGLTRLPALDGPSLPDEAHDALQALAPSGDWQPALHRRTAGLGSLGHRRVAAVGDATGGPAARELKELSPPAGVWLGESHVEAARPTAGPSWAPDPLLLVRGSWQARRLAPDCVKLDLADYGHGEERHLLRAMGFETANVHQRSPGEAIDAVRKHVQTLADEPFRQAIEELADRVTRDRHAWHAHVK
jgi:hypothetical protein